MIPQKKLAKKISKQKDKQKKDWQKIIYDSTDSVQIRYTKCQIRIHEMWQWKD